MYSSLQTDHKLYLYGGSSFILLSESAWLDVIKSDPAGVSVRKSVEDAFLLKGWVKTNCTVDPESHASTIEWLYEETGAKVKTVVDKDGQLKVNGQPIGLSTIAETYKKLHKMAEDSRLLKENWVVATPEVKDAKLKEAEKGGPHPISDILTSQPVIVNSQIIGKYEPLVAKENLSPPERMRKINRMLELAEKEENVQERERLLQLVDRECDLAEKSLKSFSMNPKALKNIDSIKIDVIPGQVVGIQTANESNGMMKKPAVGS